MISLSFLTPKSSPRWQAQTGCFLAVTLVSVFLPVADAKVGKSTPPDSTSSVSPNKHPPKAKAGASVPVGQSGLYGFIDKTGALVIPAKYSAAGSFKEGRAAVKIGTKWGVIDPTGRELVAAKYDNIWEFSEGIAAAAKGGRYGAIDHLGVTIIQPQFHSGFQFKEGLAVLKHGALYGFLDRTGEFFVKPKYSFAQNFSEGLACVSVAGQFGFIDHSGAEAIKPQFGFASSFRNGLAMVETKEKPGVYGFIDTTGKVVIEPTWDECGDFFNGLARVRKGANWGYINKTGTVVVPCNYKEAGDCRDGAAVAMAADGEETIFDANGTALASRKTGKTAWSPFPDQEPVFREGLAVAELDGGWGYIDKAGNPAFAGRYRFASDFSGGLATVQPE